MFSLVHVCVYVLLVCIYVFLCVSVCVVLVIRSLIGQSGKLLLAIVSTVILGSEYRGTHDHISLSHNSESCANNEVRLESLNTRQINSIPR
jgi:hypothetical protein